MTQAHTQPLFVAQAHALVALLRQKSPQELAALMHLSDPLAGLNAARYQAWQPQFALGSAKQAVLTFNGDVYEGLDAKSLGEDDLLWAQDHVCILSGLYGVLRPLDLMHPYRLEMGTRLATAQGRNLYQFWGAQLAHYLNERAAADATPVIINLASEEYFKAVDRRELKPRVLTCVFEECRAGQYKAMGFSAKRARGLMARYAVQQRLVHVQDLQGFDLEGWQYVAAASQPERWVFRRDAKV